MVTPQEAGYELSEKPIHESGGVARYATGDPTIFLETFLGSPAEFEGYLKSYDGLRERLLESKLEAYIPEVVDQDDDNLWIAYGVEDGLYTLRDVRDSFPDGLDGRDWAWMLRRILIVLDHTSGEEPSLTMDDILIHPEGHGIVVLGWHPRANHSGPSRALERLKVLTESVLMESVDSKKQIEFLERLARFFGSARSGFSYGSVLREYEIKLETLYGPRRFRELKVDPALRPILEQHGPGGSSDGPS